MCVDTLHRFLFEGSNIRGEVVQLEHSWQALCERQDYPEVIREILGQATAAGALLAATIKFDGSLTLQLSTDGLIKFMVVECTGEHTLRGLARWDEDEIEIKDSAINKPLIGAGNLLMTVEQGDDSERYQSIIELNGELLSECLDDYFLRSEQLPTRLWLASDGQRAAGLLLQEMPKPALETDPDLWNRVTTLAATVSNEELLTLGPDQLLRRLFHEETLRVFEPQLWSFKCPCSKARVESMLRSLGSDELHAILDEHGEINVDCEFCGQIYQYDSVDTELLLSDELNVEQTSETRH